MSYETFLKQLRQALVGIPPEEIDGAMEFYEEYFADAGPEREAEVLREMGSPGAVAAQIKADFAVRSLQTRPQTAKNGISAAWLVLLAILASPVALPLAIGMFCVGFGLLLILLVVLLALFISVVAVFLTGLLLIGICFTRPEIGAYGIIQCLGGGFICIGISVLLGVVSVQISRFAFRGIAHMLNNMNQKRKRGQSL